jgi:hypothetical protein
MYDVSVIPDFAVQTQDIKAWAETFAGIKRRAICCPFRHDDIVAMFELTMEERFTRSSRRRSR